MAGKGNHGDHQKIRARSGRWPGQSGGRKNVVPRIHVRVIKDEDKYRAELIGHPIELTKDKDDKNKKAEKPKAQEPIKEVIEKPVVKEESKKETTPKTVKKVVKKVTKEEK